MINLNFLKNSMAANAAAVPHFFVALFTALFAKLIESNAKDPPNQMARRMWHFALKMAAEPNITWVAFGTTNRNSGSFKKAYLFKYSQSGSSDCEWMVVVGWEKIPMVPAGSFLTYTRSHRSDAITGSPGNDGRVRLCYFVFPREQ